MPDNKFLLKVIKEFGRPIVATSLNIAGETSLTDLNNLSEEFKKNVDLIIDAGKTKVGVASTIIQVKEEKIATLRERSNQVLAN